MKALIVWLFFGVVLATPSYLLWGTAAAGIVFTICVALGVLSAYNDASGG